MAFGVAAALGVPLDVVPVRKLGAPGQPELGLGAIGEDGIRVHSPGAWDDAGVGAADLAAVEAHEAAELRRTTELLRAVRPRVDLTGRIAVVVDDGIATGSTARAAVAAARARGAVRVVIAVPVAPRSTVAELAEVADEVVCLESPEPFYAVGQWYDDFAPTSDREVLTLLATPTVPDDS